MIPNREINELEKIFGLPRGFYNNLLKEDDWSFIIKLHSLLEASLTHLLSETLSIKLKDSSVGIIEKNDLAANFSWLEMSGKKVGKISLAYSLGLILDEQKNFLNTFSEIRNKLIHNVKNINFTFEEYVRRFDKNQKKIFVQAFVYGVIPSAFISKEKYLEFPLRKPKLAVFSLSY